MHFHRARWEQVNFVNMGQSFNHLPNPITIGRYHLPTRYFNCRFITNPLSYQGFLKKRCFIEYLQRMARYNQWMNQKLYAKVALLSDEDIAKDRGAFFSSILGTLNHILVGDLLWFRRFASSKACKEHLTTIKDMPHPTGLEELLFTDIRALREQRELMDKLILDFSHAWDGAILQSDIRYRDMKGNKHQRQLGELLHHLFNHQTHHRGQVTTLLFQAVFDPEATDLLIMIMEESK